MTPGWPLSASSGPVFGVGAVTQKGWLGHSHDLVKVARTRLRTRIRRAVNYLVIWFREKRPIFVDVDPFFLHGCGKGTSKVDLLSPRIFIEPL